MPGIRGFGLRAAEDAGELVVWGVEAVGVDGGRAGLEPQPRGICRLGDRPPDDSCGVDAGIEDGAAVRRRVAAVHIPPRQVDDNAGAIQCPRPRADGLGVPRHDLPRRRCRRAAEYNHFVAVLVEVAAVLRQCRPRRTLPPGMTTRMTRSLERVLPRSQPPAAAIRNRFARVSALGVQAVK